MESYSQAEIDAILEKEIQDFFPKNGKWSSSCFKKSIEVNYNNLPCFLRNNAWMSKLFYKNLKEKGIDIPIDKIQQFLDSSEDFSTLRHKYELEIVKLEIEFIMGGGEGWLMPSGFSDISMLYSPDIDKIVRGGVVKTFKSYWNKF